MKRQVDEVDTLVTSRRWPKTSLLALLASLSMLTACGPGVYLGSTEPATIEGYEREREIRVYSDPEPAPIAYRVLSLIPSVDILAFIAKTAIVDSERTLISRTVYAEALRISRIDGKAVPLTTNKIEVPFGEHTIEVKYCRYEELHSACSHVVVLSFYAEPGERYRLYRNSEFQVELKPRRSDRKTFLSKARAVVAQDEGDCIRKRKSAIETRAQNGFISRAKATRLLSEVKPDCRFLVRGATATGE